MIFNYDKAKKDVASIVRINSGKGRKHPVYKFLNRQGKYVCEVRYGGASANALQRGLWTHTKNGTEYFKSITNGWIDYSHNLILVKLFSHALVSSEIGHKEALEKVMEDIERFKNGNYSLNCNLQPL